MSRKYGIYHERIRDRLNRGWTPEEACEIKINQKRSNDVIVEYKGVIKRLREFAKEYNINFSTLKHRIFSQGWTVEQALIMPIKGKEIITICGEQGDVDYFCTKFNILKVTVRERLRNGWDIEKALITPSKTQGKK